MLTPPDDPHRVVNVPLLRKTLEHITAHPEEWDQSSWAVKTPDCGTQYCLAGHVVTLQGMEVEWDDNDADGDDEIGSDCIAPDGELISIEAQARIDLGLSRDQSYHLFHGNNSLRMLWHLAGEYTNGEIQPPPDLAE